MANPQPVGQGLQSIYTACRKIYPDQPNPLQVAAVVKYWLGGPDPLDFINIYHNRGAPDRGIPAHWNYVTCGLSDLYGDGRIHEVATAPDQPSGFGFELTFRLYHEKTESAPPTWPAELLQSLARYVFQSENILCSGDHISWHSPLDKSDSRLQHMLLVQDAQLPGVDTPLGHVRFLQVVGVTVEELEAAQQWNVQGVLGLLRQRELTGGQWLVTNMRRGESLFDIDPDTQMVLDKGIAEDGSNLSGVSAVCSWEDGAGRKAAGAAILANGVEPAVTGVPNLVGNAEEAGPVVLELLRTQTLDSVHLCFNLESGRLILLALRGRLRHGRHFTFKSFTGDVAITLVCPDIQGSFTDEQHPLAAQGPWLQIHLLPNDIDRMTKDLSVLEQQGLSLPKKFEWVDKHLSVTIHPIEP